MKIYTKKGDCGYTSLIGAQKVPKHHVLVECYGLCDEVNSYLGLGIANISKLTEKENQDSNLLKNLKNIISFNENIQQNLFFMASLLAGLKPKPADKNDYSFCTKTYWKKEIELLETDIDKLGETLPPLKSFIIPGASVPAAFFHVVRSQTRKLERNISKLILEHREILHKVLNFMV